MSLHLLLVACATPSTLTTVPTDPTTDGSTTDEPTPLPTTPTVPLPTDDAPCAGAWFDTDPRCPPNPATTLAGSVLRIHVYCALLEVPENGIDTIKFVYNPVPYEDNGEYRWILEDEPGGPKAWLPIRDNCLQDGNPRMIWLPEGTATGGPEIDLNTFGIAHVATPRQEFDGWFGTAVPQVPSAACDDAVVAYDSDGWPVSFTAEIVSLVPPATDTADTGP